jgi:hypothetical protein
MPRLQKPAVVTHRAIELYGNEASTRVHEQVGILSWFDALSAGSLAGVFNHGAAALQAGRATDSYMQIIQEGKFQQADNGATFADGSGLRTLDIVYENGISLEQILRTTAGGLRTSDVTLRDTQSLFSMGGIVDTGPGTDAEAAILFGAGGSIHTEGVQFAVHNDAASLHAWHSTYLPQLDGIFAQLADLGQVIVNTTALADGSIRRSYLFLEDASVKAQTVDQADAILVNVTSF